MAGYAYERLSSESAATLEHETSRIFAHSTAVLIFESGPLGTSHGGVEFEAIRAAIASRLHRVPQYRRKLRRVPLENHPVWVDDREFNLDFHVRHTSLARPGTREQLHTLCGRLMAQRLDRSRPLWECWVLEGLDGGRFALVLKTHHAMVEGLDVDLPQVLLSTDPHERFPEGPVFRPRPMPSAFELVRDEVFRQMRLPRQAVERLGVLLGRGPHRSQDLLARAQSVARLLGYSIRALPETPLNGPVGPHRRCDHVVLPLADARAVREGLGGTIHDVLLSTVAGAVARYLRAHFVNPASLEFRVGVPVSLETGGDRSGMGEWILELPVWEPDPARRHERVCERTAELNRANPALGARMLYSVSQWTPSRLLAQGARALMTRAPVNGTVTNAPGPQVPMYLRGARLVEGFGLAPVGHHGGVAISVMSYDGKLCWGLDADFDRVRDLEVLREALVESFRELVREAARRGGRLSVVSS
jgi:diacylglycerol O-acyltransferase